MAEETGGFTGLGDIYSWLSNLGGGALGMTDPMSSAMLLPAWTSAYNQWQDADRYRESADRAIDAGRPYRDGNYYADRLKSLTEDPNAYLENSPDYQAALKQGLGGVERSNAAQGYMGSGNMLTALNDYGQMTAAKYLDQDRKSLMEMAKQNPRSGDWVIEADKNSINSRNQALDAMFLPFLMQQQAKNGNNPNGSNPLGNIPIDPASIVKAINAGGAGAMEAISKAIDAGMRFIKGDDGSTIDLWAAARAGGQGGEPGNSHYYPTGERTAYGDLPEWLNPDPFDTYNPMDPYDPYYDFGGDLGEDYGSWWEE
jgi:hypothetical protein